MKLVKFFEKNVKKKIKTHEILKKKKNWAARGGVGEEGGPYYSGLVGAVQVGAVNSRFFTFPLSHRFSTCSGFIVDLCWWFGCFAFQKLCKTLIWAFWTSCEASAAPRCGEVEDVVGALTPVVGGVAQVFHDLLVELRLLLVAEVEEGEKEDRQEEGWEVESGVGRVKERQPLTCMAWRWV